jgi:uncharacterized protein YggT (Ycf19 family)
MHKKTNKQDNINRRKDLRDDEEAYLLHQDQKRLNLAKRATTLGWIVQGIYWFFGVLELLLGFKFFLRLFGANTENQFAQLIYNLCAPFLAPFSTLFISPTSSGGGSIFDLNVLAAIIAYALLSYLLMSLAVFMFRHEP